MVKSIGGIYAVEDVTAQLRARTAPVLSAYCRLVEVENAAKRLWQTAFTARAAFKAGSLVEASTLLRAMDHAADELTDRHVQHALIAIDAERAA